MKAIIIPTDLIDLQATAVASYRWRETARGWHGLFSFISFFGLYCAVLTYQVQPQEVFALDEVLRLRVVDEGGRLKKISLLGDLFTYLNEQIMPNVFATAWYNNDTFTPAESDYILGYNKLVGGLLIVQKRGAPSTPCRQPHYSGFRSSYEVRAHLHF